MGAAAVMDIPDPANPLARLLAALERLDRLSAEFAHARALALAGVRYDPEAFDALVLAVRRASADVEAARRAVRGARPVPRRQPHPV